MLPAILNPSYVISVTSIVKLAGGMLSNIVMLAISTMSVPLFIRAYTTSVLFKFSTVTMFSPLDNVGFIHSPDVLFI